MVFGMTSRPIARLHGLWRRLPQAARRDGLLGAGATLAFFLLPAPASFGPSAWLAGWTLLAGLAVAAMARPWWRSAAPGTTLAETGWLLLALVFLAPVPFPAHWTSWAALPPRAWLAGVWLVATWMLLGAGFWGLGRLGAAVWRALAA